MHQIGGEWEHLSDSSQTMSETLGLKDGAVKCIQKKFCVYTFFGMYNLSKEILSINPFIFSFTIYFRNL